MSRLAIVFMSLVVLNGCRRYEKINLEKVIFHSTRCFGSCPAYHAQIDSNNRLLLYAEYVDRTPGINTDLNNQDTAKMGYFIGRVNNSLYADLKEELENIGLDDLEFDGITCCDGSTITIIVYYDGKRKFLKSMFPPDEATALISILRYIVESTPTVRADTTFQIEDKE